MVFFFLSTVDAVQSSRAPTHTYGQLSNPNRIKGTQQGARRFKKIILRKSDERSSDPLMYQFLNCRLSLGM